MKPFYSVDDTDLVSERVTQIIELCQTMVYQIFPNCQIFSATVIVRSANKLRGIHIKIYPQASSNGDNSGTIAYTLDYIWINVPDGEFICKDFC